MSILIRSIARWFISLPAGIFYCLFVLQRHESLGAPRGVPALLATLAQMFLGSGVALWVLRDARQRRRSLPYDFDTFVFYTWAFLAPVYLFQTRGWRAFATLGWFILLWLVATICGGFPGIVEAMRE